MEKGGPKDETEAQMKLPSPLFECIRDEDAYLVGGAVRDWILGLPIDDYDVVVVGDPTPLAQKVASALGVTPFRLGRGEQSVYRIVDDETVYDFSSLQGNCLADDLKRRDFTVNAMGYDLSTRAVVDPLGGRRDLRSRRLRLVSDHALASDPLRMLRAFRLGAVLGFEVSSGLQGRIAAEAQRILDVAPERMGTELFKLMATANSVPYLRQASTTGLLGWIIPELNACVGCTQNRFHDRDVFEHLMGAYAALEGALCDLPACWRGFEKPVVDYVETEDRRVLLKWAALLHDVGKPDVRHRDCDGRLRFIGHERQGARIVREITDRLKISHRQGDYIARMVGGHLEVARLFDAYEGHALSSKGVIRFIKKYQEDILGLLVLAVADRSAKGEVSRSSLGRFIEFGRMVLGRYLDDLAPKMAMPRLVTGHDLMRCFDLRPSELIGRLLRRIEEARLEGRINTQADAIQLAEKMLKMEGDAGIEPATPSSGGLCSIR